MGKGGDLNNKKSWHPLRAANIHATQKAEAEAIAERKKLQARLEEIKEDRRVEELQKALEAAGGKVKSYDPKLAWMYSGPTDGQGGGAAEGEAYLLGKRRIDKLLQEDEAKRLQKQSSQENFLAGPTVTNSRDTATKIREDPLLAMKKVEQQAYEALMNDPIRRRQLLASMGMEDKSSKSNGEERRHKHRHHNRSSRHHRPRDDEEREDERYSRKHRSGGVRNGSRSRRRSEDSDDEKYRRSGRRTYSKDSRSPSPRRSGGTANERYARSRGLRDSRDRSPSPRRYDAQDRMENRSRSPRRYDSRDREDRRRSSRGYDTGERRARNRSRSTGRYDSGNKGARRKEWDEDRNGSSRSGGRTDEEERARKLRAMQADASALDEERDRRLAAIERADKAAQEADDKARQRDKYRSDRHFTASIHRQAADRAS